MRLPLELLAIVLQQAIGRIPLKDIISMRLVCNFFAKEIITLIMKEPIVLENEGFGFEAPNEPRCENKRWMKFPMELKRQYLHLKVQLHTQRPCLFSHHTREMLDLPNNRTPEETVELVDSIIDCFLWGGYDCVRNMLDPRRHYAPDGPDPRNLFIVHSYYGPYQNWEPATETLNIALAISAIIRSDVAGLENIYQKDEYIITNESGRFFVYPWIVAAKTGSEDIIKLVIRHWVPQEHFPWTSLNHNNLLHSREQRILERILTTCIRAGNLKAIKLFLRFFLGDEKEYDPLLEPAARASLYIKEHSSKKRGEIFKLQKLLYEPFIQTITFGQVNMTRYMLDRGALNFEGHWKFHGKGALFTALHDCPLGERPSILRLLLDYGVDPNQSCLGIPRTPFQTAVYKGDAVSAATLAEYGADFHAPSLGSHPAHTKPLLLQAIQHRSAALVQVLFNIGFDRVCTWRKKRYTVHDGTEKENLRKIHSRLRWDQEGESTVGYCVTVQRLSHLKSK